MKKLLLPIFTILCVTLSFAQTNEEKTELVLIKSMGWDNTDGSNMLFIEFTNQQFEDVYMIYELEKISEDSWTALTLNGEILVKVENANPITETFYELQYYVNSDLMHELSGKKAKITYFHEINESHILGYIDYLRRIELVE